MNSKVFGLVDMLKKVIKSFSIGINSLVRPNAFELHKDCKKIDETTYELKKGLMICGLT